MLTIRRECFFLEVAKEETGEAVVEVSVIKGGLLDILIDVFDPHDNKLFSRMFFEGKGGNEIKFAAEVRRKELSGVVLISFFSSRATTRCASTTKWLAGRPR